MGDENENLVCPSPWDFMRSSACCKILRHGISGFISHPKEDVLRIIIALKNPSNPQPLGPVASTLTTTPPRRLRVLVPSEYDGNADYLMTLSVAETMAYDDKMIN
jgi:hypothetical protein